MEQMLNMMIETARPPLALLDELQRIENEQGRVRLRDVYKRQYLHHAQ